MALDDKYDDIKKLIDTGKEKGYLTYDQVNDLIPHDVHSPEDLDDLLTTIGTQGIDVLEGPPADEWMARVRVPGLKAVIERVFVIHVEAFDWNCPQHITPRYTAEEIQEAVEPMEERLRALELENAALRSEAAGR